MLRSFVVLIQLVVSGRTAAFNHHCTPTTASDAMTSITCRMGAAEECRSLRVLCLHGKGGNGEQFTVSSLAPLREMVERRLRGTDATVEWHHLTGPFRLNEEDVSAGHAWWTLRPGERSFNAKEVRLLMKMVDDCCYTPLTSDEIVHRIRTKRTFGYGRTFSQQQ